MCSGFTHQHTVEETHPRSQTVEAPPPRSPPHPCLLLPHRHSILPFPPDPERVTFRQLLHGAALPLYRAPPPPLLRPSPPPLSPRRIPSRSVFSIFNVFYLSKEARVCVQLPNKGKTPSCHLRKMLRGWGGGGRSSREGGGGGGITGSRVKREMLREGDRKMRQRECCSV